jgi:hypothetical protein
MPFLWDVGNYIKRDTLTIADQASMDAVLEGAGKK